MVSVAKLVESVEGQRQRKSGAAEKEGSVRIRERRHSTAISEVPDLEGAENKNVVGQNDEMWDLNTPEDLQREVERLRLEVAMAARHNAAIGEGEVQVTMPPEAVAKGFSHPDDFVVRRDTVKYDTGAAYEGELLGNMRHGKGTFTDTNGTIYSGEWKYDILDGRAQAHMADGSSFTGEWVAGNPHGQGSSFYPNSGKYEGDFENGGRHGWGTMVFAGGDIYEGEWVKDKINGQGRWSYPDGSYYEGSFKDGMRVSGKYVSADSLEEYKGEWSQGIRHGKGILFRKDLGVYEGQFDEDLPHGVGTFKFIDGSVYDGEWKAGRRSGTGMLKQHDEAYHGEWKDDAMHGKGILSSKTGFKYVGEFRNGLKEGKGRMQYMDGSVYEGEWKEGCRSGQGSCKYANGDKYVGQWLQNNRNGYGYCKFADGTKFRGNWEDDGWVQTGADPDQTRVAGAGATRAIAGNKATFIIQARDDLGNQRLNGGDAFQVHLVLHDECTIAGITAKDIISISANVEDKGNGMYEVSYIPTISGVYEMNITLESTSEHIADSPYPLRVLPGDPFLKTTRVEGPGREGACCGEKAFFEVLVCDKYGNICSGASWYENSPIYIRLEGNKYKEEIPISSEFTTDGRILCEYTAPEVECYCRLYIENKDGIAAPGTPFAVRISESEHVKHPGGIVDQETKLDPESSQTEADKYLYAGTKIKGDNETVPDLGRMWKKIASEAYAQDGDMTGWDSDEEIRKETEEDVYIKRNPQVPVVENLEDLWLVSKLQQERKAKEAETKHKKLAMIKSNLEGMYGPGEMPSVEEAQRAIKEILSEELRASSSGDGENLVSDDVRPNVPALSLQEIAFNLDDLA